MLYYNLGDIMSSFFRQMIEKTKDLIIYEDIIKIFDELDKSSDK